MSDIMEKAKELGMLIAESDELKNLKSAEEAQMADTSAQELMMAYYKKREELAKKANEPDITKEDFEGIQDAMQMEFNKLCENENIKNYLEAQSAFSNMMQQVNSIISYFVQGKEEGGCTGSCSTCGGCH